MLGGVLAGGDRDIYSQEVIHGIVHVVVHIVIAPSCSVLQHEWVILSDSTFEML